MLVAQSYPTLCKPWTVASQASLSVGFPGKNTGVGSHSLLQGVFPGIEPGCPALHADSLPSEPSDLYFSRTVASVKKKKVD